MPAWVRLIVLAIFAIGAVKFAGDALRLHAKADADCPAVSDVNPGRGLDFNCSTYGGTSKDSAVLMLAILGLAFGGVTVFGAIGVVRGMRRPGESAGDALADERLKVSAGGVNRGRPPRGAGADDDDLFDIGGGLIHGRGF